MQNTLQCRYGATYGPPMAHALWKLARRDRCWLNVIESHLCSVPLAVNSRWMSHTKALIRVSVHQVK